MADWWAAMGAAERVRRLADWGLHELLESEAHEAHRLEAQGRADQSDPYHQASMAAARERAELARAEADNQLVEHNAMTLISMVGALDALVEELVPSARKLLVEVRARQLVEEVRAQHPEAAAQVSDAIHEGILQTTQRLLAERIGSIDAAPRGAGASRWETVLGHAGLQAPPDRSIPPDLDEALTEVVALRHVLAHRAGRIDTRALNQAPSLRYVDGDLVRVSRDDYRRYSAALWTYGEEIIRRLLGGLAPDGTAPLAEWRHNYTINA